MTRITQSGRNVHYQIGDRFLGKGNEWFNRTGSTCQKDLSKSAINTFHQVNGRFSFCLSAKFGSDKGVRDVNIWTTVSKRHNCDIICSEIAKPWQQPIRNQGLGCCLDKCICSKDNMIIGLKLTVGYQGHGLWCPFDWPQCPSQKSLFGLGHFDALSRPSNLYCNKDCTLEESGLAPPPKKKKKFTACSSIFFLGPASSNFLTI